jgi:hypothetical protein
VTASAGNERYGHDSGNGVTAAYRHQHQRSGVKIRRQPKMKIMAAIKAAAWRLPAKPKAMKLALAAK